MKKSFLFGAIVFSCIIWLNFPSNAQVDLYLDNINVYVTKYGRVAIYSLPDTTRQIYKTAILVGTGQTTVFDLQNDYEVEEPTQLISNPIQSDFEIYGSYNNDYSSNPPNVLTKQNVYCWQDLSSILVKYTIINREQTSIDAIIGHELIPEVQGTYSGNDTVKYSNLTKIIKVTKNEAVGYKPLSDNLKSLYAFIYYDDFWLGDTLFYKGLTYTSFDSLFITDPNDPNVDGPVLIPAYNQTVIAPNDSVVVYLAIAYGVNEQAMLNSLQQVEEKYNLITDVENIQTSPTSYALDQNYPNPFNPSTKISYHLTQNGFVSLKVYNAIGKEVATLVNEEKSAGRYEVNFDATGLTSGVYFYTIKANNFTQTNKMLLIK